MAKFLVINPFGIGDCLFTTPVIQAIKEDNPGSFIGYWCNLRVKELLEFNKKIDKIFALSRGDLKKISSRSKLEGLRKLRDLFFGLKREKFDIALDYSLDNRYGLVSKLAGIKRRIGFNYRGRGRFLSERLELCGYRDKHVVEYYLDLLGLLGIGRPAQPRLELDLCESDKIKAKNIFTKSGIKEGELLIAMAPGGGASWGKDAALKWWPAENFAQLGDRIIERLGAKVLLLGDASERAITQEVRAKMDKGVLDLTAKTTLAELTAIVGSLDLLIANDGGPLHIAVALEKKTVSFFGPVDPALYGPYPLGDSRHAVLKRSIECSPCYRDFRLKGCQRHKECLSGISVAEAYAAAAGLLKKEA